MTGFLSEDLRSIKLEHEGIMPRVFQPWGEKRLLLDISIFRRRRTDKQNRYIHGPVCTRVMLWHLDNTGEKLSHDEVYAYLRRICGHRMKITMVNGTEVITMTGKRFSQMNTVEFGEAIDTLKAYFDPQGCEIPEPRGDNLWTDYANDDE